MTALMNSVVVGTTARVTALVTVTGTPTDPSSISLLALDPGGNLTTLSGTKTAVGNYYADVSLAIAGLWVFRWESGSPNAVQEGTIKVTASGVVAPGF